MWAACLVPEKHIDHIETETPEDKYDTNLKIQFRQTKKDKILKREDKTEQSLHWCSSRFKNSPQGMTNLRWDADK